MNKQEKIIVLLLGAALAWCLYSSVSAKKNTASVRPAAATAAMREEKAGAASAPAAPAAAKREAAAAVAPSVPEEIAILENAELRLEISTWGGAVKKATLKKYARGLGEPGEGNPPVEFDFSGNPLGAMRGADGATEVFAVKENAGTEILLEGGRGRRRIVLEEGYKVTFSGPAPAADGMEMSLGAMETGATANDMLSVDTWEIDETANGRPSVVHHDDDDSPMKPFLAGAVAGGCGCGGARDARAMPAAQSVAYAPGRTVASVALKDRFFTVALAESDFRFDGISATVERDTSSAAYRPRRIAASARLARSGSAGARATFYIGPKKQSLLWSLGMKDVMEFGMWRWLCYPMVWILAFFHSIVPSYGVAIVLLTVLVRLVFWPLTRKSTEGMRKMQEIQPLLKELQAKFKDNPQRLQQETWALYREKKVNPLSSCLPMFVQIPVFIALFNVLRSAVELRYAGFLWIADLSEPEHLFASWFPFGGLNILPILMAATMYLQSKLTPQAGDAGQQKMMTVFMPLMMLFMFYNFASALSLYWTVSQVLSIVQMWHIRRNAAKNAAPAAVEVVPPPTPTRQMRRHG